MKKIAIFALAATSILASAPVMAVTMVVLALIFLNWTPMGMGKLRRRK